MGDVRNVTEVIGQYKSSTAVKIYSIMTMFAADATDEANNFTSESPYQMQPEHSRKDHQRTCPRNECVRLPLPVISPQFWASMLVRFLQLAKTVMSPAEHSLSIVSGLARKRKEQE